VQVLEDVEEAVNEEGVVLDKLVVLGDLGRRQQPQLRVDRLVPLHRHRGRGGIRSNRIPAGRRRESSPPARPRRVREWCVAAAAASGSAAAAAGEAEVGANGRRARRGRRRRWVGRSKCSCACLFVRGEGGDLVVDPLESLILSGEVVLQIDTCGTWDYSQRLFLKSLQIHPRNTCTNLRYDRYIHSKWRILQIFLKEFI
jgi:hypothetical protein